MWGQVSLKKALKGYLTGRTVKAVDLSAEVVRDLSEVMEALSDGVVFFAETVAVENIEFKEEAEEMVMNIPVTTTEADEADEYYKYCPECGARMDR